MLFSSAKNFKREKLWVVHKEEAVNSIPCDAIIKLVSSSIRNYSFSFCTRFSIFPLFNFPPFKGLLRRFPTFACMREFAANFFLQRKVIYRFRSEWFTLVKCSERNHLANFNEFIKRHKELQVICSTAAVGRWYHHRSIVFPSQPHDFAFSSFTNLSH